MPNLIYTAVGDDGTPSTGDTLLGDLQGIQMNEQVQVENHVMLDSESITLHEDLAFNGEILHQASPSKSTDEEERNTTEEFCIVPSGLSFYQVMPSRGQRSTVNVTINELGKQLLGCAKEGDVDGVRSLMAKGAPFASDFLGTSALHLAAQHNQFSTAELLLRAGISRDARTKVEKTALHVAATEGHVSLVQLLISYGAEVNARDMLRMTPLHWAVDRGHVEVIRVLLECGASTDVRSKFDKTPLDVAKDYSRTDLVDFMQSIEPLQQPADTETTSHENDREMEAATRSIAVENVHVPAVLHQEEVETSVQDGGSNHPIAHDYLDKRAGGSSRGPSIRASLEEELARSSNSTMQLLEAHGITMLPEDEETLVESVLERGQTVVLTDAGKLALEHSLKGLQPKMLKKISSGQAVLVPNQSTKGLTTNSLQSLPKKTIAMRQYKAHIPEKKSVEEAERILARAVAGSHSSTELVDDTCSVEELEKKVEEALQAARHHKELALEKERQVVMYRRQMEMLKPYLSWPMSAVRRARRKAPKFAGQRRGNSHRPVLPFIAPRLDFSQTSPR